MFRVVKLAFLTVSGLMLIVGVFLLFLGSFILYLNRPTTKLFKVLEDLCKTKNDQYGGTDMTSSFVHVTIQAVFSLPIGVCIVVAGVLSIMGAGHINLKLLKMALVMWVSTFGFLFIFLVYSAACSIEINEPYMYCWLSILTDLLQRGADETDEVMALLESTQLILDCCGVRGPQDYEFYSEMFGSDRYPRSCCFNKKGKHYDCSKSHIAEKFGCYEIIERGLGNRKSMFTFALVFTTLFLCPLIWKILWMIRGIHRHDHVHIDDMEDSSENSGETEPIETNKS